MVAFREQGHYQDVVSYLVLGTQRAVCVDTGLGIGGLAALVRQRTALPVTVVNTHSHWDHRGENAQFTDIQAHYLEAPLLEQPGGIPPSERAASAFRRPRARRPRPLPPGFDSSRWEIAPSSATAFLKEGDKIPLGGRSLTVLHTPGHSPGSICLLDSERRSIFTGDTYYPGPLYAYQPGANLADYCASADRLAHLAVGLNLVFPGHNATSAKPGRLIDMARAFDSVMRGTAKGRPADDEPGVTEYYRDSRRAFGFSILVRDRDIEHSR